MSTKTTKYRPHPDYGLNGDEMTSNSSWVRYHDCKRRCMPTKCRLNVGDMPLTTTNHDSVGGNRCDWKGVRSSNYRANLQSALDLGPTGHRPSFVVRRRSPFADGRWEKNRCHLARFLRFRLSRDIGYFLSRRLGCAVASFVSPRYADRTDVLPNPCDQTLSVTI